jgi:uncharacterized protein with HEPN domain
MKRSLMQLAWPDRRDDALLLDMLIAARKIHRYTENMSFVQFNANDMAQSAVIRELQVMARWQVM